MIKKSEGKCIGRAVDYRSSEFNSSLKMGFRLKTALLIAPVMWDEFQNFFYAGNVNFLFHSINTLTPWVVKF